MISHKAAGKTDKKIEPAVFNYVFKYEKCKLIDILFVHTFN